MKNLYKKLPASFRENLSTARQNIKNLAYKTLEFLNKKSFRFPHFFYSQQGEDRMIYEVYYKNNPKRNGIFVELGAYDGITYSNTKFFEDTLEWNGVLIEPVPENYKLLVRNRPNCLNLNVAVGNKEKSLFIGKSATSGNIHSMSENYKKEFHPNIRIEDCYNVNCRTLSSIFIEFGINEVDLFSLDVEGAELEALSTIDWHKVNINLFLIELEGTDKIKDEECRKVLKEHGFEFQRRIGNNDLWKNPDF